jgi:DNA-binding SARP family transcriptional activator/tetratricopeptide (TPR) repeat protein
VESRFRILGAIDVDVGGRPARIPRGRALSFLALLLVHRGAAVHLDRVLDELWEGAGPRNTRNAVHVVASRLRAALGEGAILSAGGGYAVALTPGALDADRFEEGFRRGRDELARGEPIEAAATLRQALALWRGPALADVRDERFAAPEIARLDDLQVACLSERLDADLACGRDVEVAGEIEALVREHPLRERLHGQRMLALYRAGRQADALAAYRSARGALVDGLGIEPSPALRQLEAAILRQDVPVPVAAPRPPTARAPVAHDARRRVTCVFSQLAVPDALYGLEPETLRTMLERYHDGVRAVCARHGGTVTELRSDAVLVAFGIPAAHEDDAQRALRAATELGARSAELVPGMRTRCGVSTGDVVAPAREDAAAAVIGEAVADAERLARRAADGEVLISESTWRLVRHAARTSALTDGAFVLDALDPDAPAIRRRLDRPLIGRDEEIGRLRDTLAHVVAERAPHVVTILGEPGIGKSRLVAELAAIAREHATVLTGRCPAYGDGVTYWPLREIVLQAAGDRSLDDLAAVLGLAPAVARRLGSAARVEHGEAGDETRSAFLQLIVALARTHPLVVIVDDVHWAEPALLDLLLDVGARLSDTPALLVCVARPDLLEARPGWASRIAHASTLTLGPLSPAASAALLGEVAGGDLGPDDERRIAAAAGGNPLFLEQLVAYVGEQRSTDALPPAIHALLAARLDRLDAGERSALALGAVAGDSFEAASVHALTAGVTRAEVEYACDRLVERDLLVRGGAGVTGTVLRFRHALIRDAAYASLAKSARARLHERHAKWLAELGDDLPEADARIGFHLEIACRYVQEVGGRAPAALEAQAGRRLAAAAASAHARGDIRGQIGFLERAVALLGSERTEGAELFPGLVLALFEAGSIDRALPVADLGVSAAAALGLRRALARAVVERERIRLCAHPEDFDVVSSILAVEQATATLEELGDDLGLARAAYMMCDLAWLSSGPAAANVHAERMLAYARKVGSGFDVARAITFVGWSMAEGPVPVPAALERCDALAREAAGQRAAEMGVLGCRATLLAMAGRFDESREAMARARDGLAELGLDATGAYFALLDALAQTIGGDPTAAERAVLDAGAIVAESGDRWFLSMVNVELAHAILAQDRPAEAAAAVARIDTVPAPCDPQWRIKRHAARALEAAGRSDHDHALQEAQAAVRVADQPELIVLAADAERTLAEVLRSAGREADATAAAARALVLDEAKGNSAAAAATRRRFAALALPVT